MNMTELRGQERQLRVGILGSTRGTDMQAIIEAILDRRLHASIAVVVSDREQAGILERAGTYGIPAYHIPTRTNGVRKDRRTYDTEVDEVLKKHKTELVVLIGYMRIVSPLFCSRWKNRMINVHPSLLPDFAGGMDTDVHAAVLASGRSETGCTVHLVTEEVDGGPILEQRRCSIRPEDTPETLKGRVQQLEGAALIEVIERFSQPY